MPGISRGEVWLVDFGMVAKMRQTSSLRPAFLAAHLTQLTQLTDLTFCLPPCRAG
jgi:hypothetical protein